MPRAGCALLNPGQPLTQNNLPAGCTLNGDASISFVTPGPVASPGQLLINEYAGVFGLWARPLTNWKIGFDADLMRADNVFTRVSPRQSQEYRVRTTYKPIGWLNLDGAVTIWEATTS